MRHRPFEEWRFKNRAQSKSEAIRRLVQIGLRVDREAPKLLRNCTKGVQQIGVGLRAARETAERGPEDASSAEVATALFRNIQKSSKVHNEALQDLIGFLEEIGEFLDNQEFDHALKIAEERRQKEEERRAYVAELEERQDREREEERELSDKVVAVFETMTPDEFAAYEQMSKEEQYEFLDRCVPGLWAHNQGGGEDDE